jgi:Zn-dependent protease
VIFGEPPRTQADLNFNLFNIPVRIHPFFWVVAVLLGIQGQSEVDPAEMILWIVSVLVSITIHELGHAFAIRRFGGRPWVVLHAFGGLAFGRPGNEDMRTSVIISLAGPVAGFLFAAVIVALIAVSGHLRGFQLSWTPVDWEFYRNSSGDPLMPLNFLIWQLLFINIMWGLMNLLPIYPLDGGQVARAVMIERDPYNGPRQSLILSIAVGVCIAVYAAVNRQFYIAALFGYLAYLSYSTLQSYTGGGRRW